MCGRRDLSLKSSFDRPRLSPAIPARKRRHPTGNHRLAFDPYQMGTPWARAPERRQSTTLPTSWFGSRPDQPPALLQPARFRNVDRVS